MTTLIVAAFGHLSPNPNLPVSSAEEDLYSVFLARSELMRWSDFYSTTEFQLTSPLWAMNEAELTYAKDGPEIGFAQVGLDVGPTLDATPPSQPTLSREEATKLDPSEYDWAPYPIETGPPTDPAVAIPPLIQCLDEALRWFGETDATAIQVTATDIRSKPRSRLHYLSSVRNWLDIGAARSRVPTVVTVAADQWDEHMAAHVFTDVQRRKSRSFEIGPLIVAPDGYVAGPEWRHVQWTRADTGVAVSMPAWTPATIGWVIARVFDAALSHDPAPKNFSVRLTRTDPLPGD